MSHGKTTLAHKHSLICTQNSARSYSWICDFCSRKREEIRESFAYCCESCNFAINLCWDCIQPKHHPDHVHALQVTDTSNWICDICRRPNRPGEILSRHCKECQFNACRYCFHRHISSLHEHPLFRVDSHHVYPESRGGWFCKNCLSIHHDPADNWPWHCHTCHNYDLCNDCVGAMPGVKRGKMTLAHEHLLFCTQNSARSCSWICDFCSRKCEEIREAFAYRCESCDFDLCWACIQPKHHPGHDHALQVADTSNWICDICRCPNRPGEILSRHCKECQFNACRYCFHRHISSLHEHPLFRVDSHHVYQETRGGWFCNNCPSIHHDPADNWPWHCHSCHNYDLCDDCIGAMPGVKTDAEDDVRKQVSPHFLLGLRSLENFVKVLETISDDVSEKTAQLMMPDLLGFVTTSHTAFCHATSTIHQINERLDSNIQTIVVKEKSTNDSLEQTWQSFLKLEEKVKVLQDECDEAKEQLYKLDLNLRREEESLRQRRKQLENAKRDRSKGVALGFALGAIFGGAIGIAVVGGIATAVHNTNVSNAEQAVNEASNHATSTRGRFAAKETELCNLIHEQEDQEIVKRRRCQELELLKYEKKHIKKSQERLAKLNYSIKSCTTFLDTTSSRAKMMADEASGKLPDIEAMVLPLKAIAGDIAEASLSNTRLLSGRVDMKEVGAKIKMITSKALKSVTSGEIDQWA